MEQFECFSAWGLDELHRRAAAAGWFYRMERSIRLQPGEFEPRRLMFSFPADQPNFDLVTVQQVCRAMRGPGQVMQNVSRFFPSAAHVHFGFEQSAATVIGKCYLELPPSDHSPSNVERLQFLGFKWSINDDSVYVVTRYRQLPPLAWPDVCKLILPLADPTIRPGLTSLLNAAAPPDKHEAEANSGEDHTGPVLQIEEEGSNRHSYDVNVYNHTVPLAAVRDAMQQLSAGFEISKRLPDEWVDQHSASTLGHIAVGRGRQDQPFVTVYHE